ncbi:MAG: antitermination regulator [Comamonadaceae bacterium]|nr:antitermination regulator [Comamonadaceae bacterium]
MKSGLHFLVAAKRCEIDELEQLARTSALVNVTGRLVHGLQRERGLSNLVLGSQGTRFTEARAAQIVECLQIETELRLCLDCMDTNAVHADNGARLFSRIAYVLHGLDALPALRERVDCLAWTVRQSTEAYIRLINGLLTVVFEAADSATDPEISRLLVALFNFMQGKEFAGQERAAGSALFAAGRADAAEQQRLLHLIESQERCLQVFQEFATSSVALLWSKSQDSATLAELERLRRILCTAGHSANLDATLSESWFGACSRRIDGMKAVEEGLAKELMEVCQHKIDAAQAELATYSALSDADPPVESNLSFFETQAPAPGVASAGLGIPPQGFGLHLERSILELVQEQAHRLQSMGDELDTVRASLNERKVIERAKGLLMAHRHLSEAEAHKTMRQMAMNQNRRLIEVADAVLAMAEVLPPPR